MARERVPSTDRRADGSLLATGAPGRATEASAGGARAAPTEATAGSLDRCCGGVKTRLHRARALGSSAVCGRLRVGKMRGSTPGLGVPWGPRTRRILRFGSARRASAGPGAGCSPRRPSDADGARFDGRGLDHRRRAHAARQGQERDRGAFRRASPGAAVPVPRRPRRAHGHRSARGRGRRRRLRDRRRRAGRVHRAHGRAERRLALRRRQRRDAEPLLRLGPAGGELRRPRRDGGAAGPRRRRRRRVDVAQPDGRRRLGHRRPQRGADREASPRAPGHLRRPDRDGRRLQPRAARRVRGREPAALRGRAEGGPLRRKPRRRARPRGEDRPRPRRASPRRNERSNPSPSCRPPSREWAPSSPRTAARCPSTSAPGSATASRRSSTCTTPGTRRASSTGRAPC